MIMDLVHDTQTTFRELTEAFSFPGRPVELSRWEAVDWNGSPHRVIILLAQTLLDPETAFCFLGEESPTVSKTLTRLTLAKVVEMAQAPFLLTDNARDLDEAIKSAPIGTLESPEKGGTVIFFHENEPLSFYELSGPGIKDKMLTRLPITFSTWEILQDKNSEFPLGVDLILCSKEGVLQALPRTTRIAPKNQKENH